MPVAHFQVPALAFVQECHDVVEGQDHHDDWVPCRTELEEPAGDVDCFDKDYQTLLVARNMCVRKRRERAKSASDHCSNVIGRAYGWDEIKKVIPKIRVHGPINTHEIDRDSGLRRGRELGCNRYGGDALTTGHPLWNDACSYIYIYMDICIHTYSEWEREGDRERERECERECERERERNNAW
jgi:hypothetical protein